MKGSISMDPPWEKNELGIDITATEDPELIINNKKNVLLSRISLLVSILGFVTGIYNITQNLILASYIAFIIGILLLTSFLLNKRKKHRLAKLILLGSLNLTMIIFCYSYPLETGLYIFFIPAMVLSILLLGSQDKATNHFFILLSVFSIIAVFNIRLDFIPIIPLTEKEIARAARVNLGVSIVLLGFSFYWLVNLTSQTEQWLSEIVKRTVNKSKELEKANKELDKFIYRTSHDLRSPLSSVKGLATIATHETQDATAQHFLKEIVLNIERLDSFTKEIIEYSKNALTDVMLENVNFQVLVTETIDSLKYMTEATPIHFLYNIDPNLDIQVDRRRIKIVLHNLIGNAIKYHDPKKSYQFIEIDVKRTETGFTLIVTDNGTGISQQYQSRIFDMFYRATSNSTGSGLGLYIVKEAVEKMNGTITVESTPGSSTTFTVNIPTGLARFTTKKDMLQLQN